ncbi:hypothetical protein Xmar_07905 [Xanthomonas axonopodis pv. martyniicola]|nr:hypothetical protein Xmar_07905 [Xanthomonas axonopodis pv. martyniicola]OOW90124.1 hypothetical protein Xvtr_18930 [Xanthomonas campestris pv. vitiscarnosae]
MSCDPIAGCSFNQPAFHERYPFVYAFHSGLDALHKDPKFFIGQAFDYTKMFHGVLAYEPAQMILGNEICEPRIEDVTLH